MILISPPFGNYLNFSDPDVVSVKGTYTWHKRRGLIYHTLRSLRPVSGGWRNQIGLRNPGIRSVNFNSHSVYSVAAIKQTDWVSLFDFLPQVKLELNLSCPNVDEMIVPDFKRRPYVSRFPELIVKVSPNMEMCEIEKMIGHGVKTIHMSNTLRTEKGGISGKMLKEVNLPRVEQLATKNVQVIAGGGIYSPQDVLDYWNAGANGFSVSTVFLSYPWRFKKIRNKIKDLQNLNKINNLHPY